MPNEPSLSSATPGGVLAVYAEPLVVGRRVALVGIGDDSIVETLQALGARVLYVYDPRPSVVANKIEGGRVTIMPLRSGEIGVRDGAFDVAIVPDLSLLGDHEAALALVRRLVGHDGVAIIASRNPDCDRSWLPAGESADPPSYTSFYELCTLQFADVRMLGAAPFAGYAVAEFAPEREPDIAFDASLVAEPEPTEWFIAVVGQSETEGLEAYEVVQIPTAAVDPSSDRPTLDRPTLDGPTRQQLALVEQKLHEAEARAGDHSMRAERLAAELRTVAEESRKQRDALAKQQKELDEERRRRSSEASELGNLRRGPDVTVLQARVASLEAELIEARTQLATPRAGGDELLRLQQDRERFSAELTALRERATVAERLLQPLRSEVEKLQRKLADRERELEASLKRGKELEDRLEEQLVESSSHGEELAIAQRLQHQVAQAEAVIERAQAELLAVQATHLEDVATLEAALRARGEELRAARAELVRRERLVRELVQQLEDLQQAEPASAPVERTLPAAAETSALQHQLELARRELALLVEEVRRRESAIEPLRAEVERLTKELDVARANNEQLARDAARREASLQTASWRIAELEKLGTEPDEAKSNEPAAPSGEAHDAARKKLESELDALRRALTQEHERTVALQRQLEAAATGSDAGELARAQARLAEREALIAQLSAELASRAPG
jgi:hypothetical protein